MTPKEIRMTVKGRWHDCPNEAYVEVLAEIAAQLSEMNANYRAVHPELDLPEECRKQQCDYYTGYLAHNTDGSENMPHAAYHIESESAGQHFKNCTSTDICKTCERLERRLRA